MKNNTESLLLAAGGITILALAAQQQANQKLVFAALTLEQQLEYTKQQKQAQMTFLKRYFFVMLFPITVPCWIVYKLWMAL